MCQIFQKSHQFLIKESNENDNMHILMMKKKNQNTAQKKNKGSEGIVKANNITAPQPPTNDLNKCIYYWVINLC